MRTPLKERSDFNSFVDFCKKESSSDLRFWQALKAWAREYYEKDFDSGTKPPIDFIYAGFDEEAMVDTFYWEDVGEDIQYYETDEF